jgi:DNA-binding transcriptional LysR family regulator
VSVELADLRSFAAIVEGGSLTAAARRTRRSLATVSRQLRALEEELGITLARRTTRRLAVTSDGRDLYERAVRILRDVAEAREVGRSGGLLGNLVVSLPVTLGQALLLPRLAQFMREHPRLHLDIRLEDRLADLVVEGVDVVVRAGTPLPDSAALVASRLLDFQRIPVAAPDALGGRAAPREPAEIARIAGLVHSADGVTRDRWILVRGAEEAHVQVPIHLISTAPLVLLEAARGGMGAALLPTWLVADDLRRGRLVQLAPGWASPPVTVWSMYRSTLRGTPAVRAFLEALQSGSPLRMVSRQIRVK